MKISDKADYALHAMMYVASLKGHHPATITEIARAENIPREYLAKILGELRKAGLLRPKRGRDGGYLPGKPRGKITFLDIVEAMDGPVEPSNCTKLESRRQWHKKGACPALNVFERIKRGIVRELDSVVIDDIPYEKFYKSFALKTGSR
ncbi:MAG: hypothetical protein A2W25_00310 [candidate division Zixibacteria bacterium RBG_16_53_22]|nr:MAG: hypothetical protein A2W25_00310 [candidate division Zixibacteria bacterium RBG_16_53_22]